MLEKEGQPNFLFEGDTLQEEIERMIPQILDCQYPLDTRFVAKMLLMLVLNEKSRQKPICAYQTGGFRCILNQGHDGIHVYEDDDRLMALST